MRKRITKLFLLAIAACNSPKVPPEPLELTDYIALQCSKGFDNATVETILFPDQTANFGSITLTGVDGGTVQITDYSLNSDSLITKIEGDNTYYWDSKNNRWAEITSKAGEKAPNDQTPTAITITEECHDATATPTATPTSTSSFIYSTSTPRP